MSQDSNDPVQADEDYIVAPRYSNSLSQFLKKNHGKETPTPVIAKMLNLTEEQVLSIKTKAFKKIKEFLSGT